ncbi:epimerase family protein SDR39U1 [Nematostella vectensis]|uniref:epimerase family protein SDR39U1 n=1 Tax=Nematostella vectensis TaxID=45351 RepID=UPI002076FA69|nr:epimerase family protein SDR39U1 [Nematostella vectensis]
MFRIIARASSVSLKEKCTLGSSCRELQTVLCRGMRVLVGGGTGFVGRNLTAALKSKGHDIVIISRTAGPGKVTWDQITKSGLPQCQAVVNLAGENVLNALRRWDDKYKEDVVRSRVETTKLLADKITTSQNPPSVFVSSSAVGFYPPSETKDYGEDTPPSNADYFTSLCAEWEAAAQLPKECKTRNVVVRIGVVLGRDGGTIQQAYWPFFFGGGGVIGSGRQFFPWIHIQDICGIIIHAIENNHVTGAINGVAPEIATNKDFTEHLAGAMWRPAIIPMPAFAINTVFGSERATMLLQGQKVHPKRTLESGYTYKYPELKAALQNAIK